MTEDTILREVFGSTGFVESLRAGTFDTERFNTLLEAIVALKADLSDRDTVDRLIACALFELPWEIENMADALKGRLDYDDIDQIMRAAALLRERINEALGEGLNDRIDPYLM